MPHSSPTDLAWPEVQVILDEEIQRLPVRYRTVFVLCCLEGKNRAEVAQELGLKVNAGHGLHYVNLPELFKVPHLVELNIGHSIVSRAMTVGLGNAVSEMLRLMKRYRR